MKERDRGFTLLEVVDRAKDLEFEIRPEDAGVDDRAGSQGRDPSRFDDNTASVPSRSVPGSADAAANRSDAETDRILDLEVGRPEVVTPLRHAMRFVDDDEIDRRSAAASR